MSDYKVDVRSDNAVVFGYGAVSERQIAEGIAIMAATL